MVGDGVHHPHRERRARGAVRQARDQVLFADRQHGAQVGGLQGGHRHALAVGGVEARDRVAERHDARGPPAHLVVAAPLGHRVPVKIHPAHGFSGPQGCADVRWDHGVGLREDAVEVLRRFGLGDPERRDGPDAVLVEQHAHAQAVVVRGADQHHLLGHQPLGDTHAVRCVGHPDLDRILPGALESPFLQPHRKPAATSGGVDHQVALDGLTVVEHHAGDPLGGRVELGMRDPAAQHRHRGQREHTLADLPLEPAARGDVCGEIGFEGLTGAEEVTARGEVDGLRLVLHHGHPGAGHVVEHAGEDGLKFLCASGHEQMHVLSLRYRTAVHRFGGQLIALVDRHTVEVVGQHPGRAQTRDTAADHDRMGGGMFQSRTHRLPR